MIRNETDYNKIPPSKKEQIFTVTSLILVVISSLSALFCALGTLGEIIKPMLPFFIVAAVLFFFVGFYSSVMLKRRRDEEAKPGYIVYTFDHDTFTYATHEEGSDESVEFAYDDLRRVKKKNGLYLLTVYYIDGLCTVTMDSSSFVIGNEQAFEDLLLEKGIKFDK